MARAVASRRTWAMLCACLLVVCLGMAQAAHAEEDPGAPMDGIVAMDAASFEALVGKERGALVEFYAPWCSHCKSMAPEYRALGQLYVKTPVAQEKVVIAKVDATKNRELATANGVTGFPTILYFAPHSTTGEKYTESRTVDGIVRFLNKKIPDVGLFVPKEVQFAVELTAADFDTVVMDATKDVMVLMYAPWCGHCKRFKPTYNKLARIYENDDDMVVAMFDADAKDHKAIGARFGLSGYPTVLFFGKNNKGAPLEYEGERELEELVVYINERTDKKRLLDGDLSWDYGVDTGLCKAVAAVMKAPEGKRAELAKQAKEKVAKFGDVVGTDYYVRVIDRVVEDPQFVNAEKARLDRMLDGTVGGKKRDNLILRFNILSAVAQHAER